MTPEYRTPEVDTENLGVSRTFDIWGLGCVIAEMACWILGGNNLKDDLRR